MPRPRKPLDPEEVRRFYLEHNKSMSKTRNHFGVHSNRIIEVLGDLYKPPRKKPMKKRSYKRTTTSQTPRTILRIADKIPHLSPEEILHRIREPTPWGRQILEEIKSGKKDTLSLREAAELLNTNPTTLFKLHSDVRRHPEKYEGRVIPLPMHPQKPDKIDAKRFVEQVYSHYQDTITRTEATELASRLFNLTPGAADSLFNLNPVPTHLLTGGYRIEDYLRALQSRLKQSDLSQRASVIKAWSPNPHELPSLSGPLRPPHVPDYLRVGMFHMSNDRLLAFNKKRLAQFKRAVESSPAYAPNPDGTKRSATLRQDRAMLRSLDLHPEIRIGKRRLLDAITHEDRRVLGSVIADLMERGEIPMHLPALVTKERRQADSKIAAELRNRGNLTPALRKIAALLEKRAAGGVIKIPLSPAEKRKRNIRLLVRRANAMAVRGEFNALKKLRREERQILRKPIPWEKRVEELSRRRDAVLKGLETSRLVLKQNTAGLKSVDEKLLRLFLLAEEGKIPSDHLQILARDIKSGSI